MRAQPARARASACPRVLPPAARAARVARRLPRSYWTSQTTGFCDPKPYRDMFLDNAPAPQDVNPLTCSQANQSGCVYEDDRVASFTLAKIAAHDPATPLFMYLTWHNNHEPLEVPQAQLDKFEFVYQNCSAAAGRGGSPNKNNTCTQAYMASADAADKGCCFRQYYSAMTNYVDMHIGQVVDALKAKNMWDNMLFVVRRVCADGAQRKFPRDCRAPSPTSFVFSRLLIAPCNCLQLRQRRAHIPVRARALIVFRLLGCVGVPPRIAPPRPARVSAAPLAGTAQPARTISRCAAARRATGRAACA